MIEERMMSRLQKDVGVMVVGSKVPALGYTGQHEVVAIGHVDEESLAPAVDPPFVEGLDAVRPPMPREDGVIVAHHRVEVDAQRAPSHVHAGRATYKHPHGHEEVEKPSGWRLQFGLDFERPLLPHPPLFVNFVFDVSVVVFVRLSFYVVNLVVVGEESPSDEQNGYRDEPDGAEGDADEVEGSDENLLVSRHQINEFDFAVVGDAVAFAPRLLTREK